MESRPQRDKTARSELSRRNFVRNAGIAVAGIGIGPSLLAACGTSGSSTTTTTRSATSLWTTQAEVEAAAKKEGKLLFYTASADNGKAWKAAFQAIYPWADITYYSATSQQILERYVTEAKSGAHLADLIVNEGPAAEATLLSANAIRSGQVPNDALTTKNLQDPKHYYHVTDSAIVVMAYNKRLVKTGIPTDVTALADPAWKNKIAFDAPSGLLASGLVMATRRALWNDDSKWTSWLQGMKANNILVTPDAGSAYQAILSGERQLGIVSFKDIFLQDPGAPVAPIYYPSVVLVLQCDFINSHAPHPNMAALFTNWLLSPAAKAGQALLADTGLKPGADNFALPSHFKALLGDNVTFTPGSLFTDVYKNPNFYLNTYQQYWPS